MKTRVIALFLALLIPGAALAVDVTVDDSELVNGFMNVFDLGMVPQFQSGWGVADLTATFPDASTVVLGPNTIGDPDPYWYIGGGGPGAPGNKIMEANLYGQVDDAFGGQTVNFSGMVVANTLTSAHTAIAFIRDFAPDFSSFVETTAPLAPGFFSLSLNTDAGAGRHVQWGFQMVGVNVWVTDVGPFGTVTIARDPAVATENSSFGNVKALFR